jgi:hypothetical protein
MKTLTTMKAIVALVLCYCTTITFSSFLVETVYAHSAGSVGSTDSNNHDHRRVVSVSELLLQVTPFTAGLAFGFTLLFWKNEIMEKFRSNKNPRT